MKELFENRLKIPEDEKHMLRLLRRALLKGDTRRDGEIVLDFFAGSALWQSGYACERAGR